MLSTRRANTVYQIIVASDQVLKTAKNKNNLTIFSLAGYGADRPLAGHSHAVPTPDSANRRIELRFVFSQPAQSEKMKQMIGEGKDVR